jgi:hypothetical protein
MSESKPKAFATFFGAALPPRPQGEDFFLLIAVTNPYDSGLDMEGTWEQVERRFKEHLYGKFSLYRGKDLPEFMISIYQGDAARAKLVEKLVEDAPNTLPEPELPDKIRLLLKRFYPRRGWEWDTDFWDEHLWMEHEYIDPEIEIDTINGIDGTWLLSLRDSNDGDIDFEAGFICVVPTKDGKWGVWMLIGDEDDCDWDTDDLIFVSNTPQEAKCKVDMLLGSNSGEIPEELRWK